METGRATYLTDALGPLPFCPGCGHERILKDLDKALVKLQLKPHKTVIVSDIGCIGLADRYFTTNAFHGLHGRSLTYATGLKLACPELTVIVLMGDGGCGIGGTHLLNAARRNVDVTLIVANNFNYGMTGGQHSVTTPAGGLTATTPGGNIEGTMDICATAIGAGATWVYRGLVYDGDLPDRIAEAISHPGFAMLDIWGLCTAYYLPQNDLNKKKLYALVESSGLKVGLLARRSRPEFGAAYREHFQNRPSRERAVPIAPEFTSQLTRRTGIVIAGSAGHKVRSMTTLLARAGMLSGLRATQKDDYPITVMTGHSVSEVILSPEAIDYTGIEAPDYVVIISPDGLKKSRKRIQALDSAATLIVDRDLACPETAARVVTLPIAETARSVGPLSIAAVAVAALLREAGLFPLAALEAAIRRYQKPEIAERTIRAARQGAALISTSDSSHQEKKPRSLVEVEK